MKKLLILGGSGIGMIAAYIAELTKKYKVIGFLNDILPLNSTIGKYKKYKVIGKSEDVEKFVNESDIFFFIAYVGLGKERQTFEKISKLPIPREKFATLIHPTAVIPFGFCKIGTGVLFGPLSQLSPDTTISDNCIILGNAFVGHDSILDRFAHVATNAVVGANVYIGKGVHVGSNATIREKVKVGNFSLIGAGAVVLNDVPENSVVVGNPAYVLRKRD